MSTRLELTLQVLDTAFGILSDNRKGLRLEEALFIPAGGFRSIVGTIKHAAGWSHVYRSYAFDTSPTPWSTLEWPHGLRRTIIKSEPYLADLIHWLDLSHTLWQQNLLHLKEDELDQLRPVHWGDTMPLFNIVRLIANHHIYHAGEINQLLAISRQASWEAEDE